MQHITLYEAESRWVTNDWGNNWNNSQPRNHARETETMSWTNQINDNREDNSITQGRTRSSSDQSSEGDSSLIDTVSVSDNTVSNRATHTQVLATTSDNEIAENIDSSTDDIHFHLMRLRGGNSEYVTQDLMEDEPVFEILDNITEKQVLLRDESHEILSVTNSEIHEPEFFDCCLFV